MGAKVAAKALTGAGGSGLQGKLGLALLGLKKLGVAIVAGLGAGIASLGRMLFGKKRAAPPSSSEPPPPTAS